jgi:O-antigen ligase
VGDLLTIELVLILGLLTLPRRARRWAGAIVLVAAVVAIPVSYQALAGPDVDGRADVVQTGIDLATERPIAGWGIGTFEVAATRSLEASDESIDQLTASHTTPITVITELGIVGLIAYIALLTLATASALVRWRRASRDPRQQPTGWPLASVIWATATLIALFSHSLLYAGFFEDATLWVALAVLASLPPVSSDPRDS